MPAITIYVDLDDWDARAKALGGNKSFAGRRVRRETRRTHGAPPGRDGAVTLIIPTSDRTEDDTRANAVTLANISVDPTQVTTDLSGAGSPSGRD